MIKKLCNLGELMCLVLYVTTAVLGFTKKKWFPLLSLVAMHVTEFFVIGRKTGKKEGFSLAESIANTLAFGFTWWLPYKLEK